MTSPTAEHVQVPTIGSIVRVVGWPAMSNGTDVAPAIVTRVWSEDDSRTFWTINVTVFPDAGEVMVHQAADMRLYGTEEAARGSDHAGSAAFWPRGHEG